MKCLACDTILTDFEATRRMVESKEYPDLCSKCFKTIQEDVIASENPELITTEDQTNSWDDEILVPEVPRDHGDSEWEN